MKFRAEFDGEEKIGSHDEVLRWLIREKGVSENPEAYIQELWEEVVPQEKEPLVEDSPKEDVDETSVIDEGALLAKHSARKALEEYDEWEPSTQTEIIQQTLNLTQENRGGEAGSKIKGMKGDYTTKNYIAGKYNELIEKLRDTDYTVCPICERPFTEGLSEEELSFWKPDKTPIPAHPKTFAEQAKKKTPKLPKVLENQFPKIRLIHVKAHHPAIWSFIQDLYDVPKSERRYDDPNNPQAQGQLSVEKENLAELSKEELAERISENPELRAKLFQMWKRKLEEREA